MIPKSARILRSDAPLFFALQYCRHFWNIKRDQDLNVRNLHPGMGLGTSLELSQPEQIGTSQGRTRLPSSLLLLLINSTCLILSTG